MVVRPLALNGEEPGDGDVLVHIRSGQGAVRLTIEQFSMVVDRVFEALAEQSGALEEPESDEPDDYVSHDVSEPLNPRRLVASRPSDI